MCMSVSHNNLNPDHHIWLLEVDKNVHNQGVEPQGEVHWLKEHLGVGNLVVAIQEVAQNNLVVAPRAANQLLLEGYCMISL